MKKNNELVSVVIVTRNRKKDLIECIDSYINSNYKLLEVIVVDNGSTDGSVRAIRQKYPQVKLIALKKNIGAAKGRNVGLEKASGEYILFTDDDAYADKNMVSHLVSVFKKKPEAGIVQPLVYDKQNKSLLQGAGHDIDIVSGRIKAWGVREKDIGQYEGIREVPMCGCVWMIKRVVVEKIGGYDEEYFIPYEDSDYSFRARKVGFKLFCYSEAKTYHRGHKATFIHPLIEWLGITTPDRAYRISRNKIIFMTKHSNFPENIFFFVLMLPAYTALHSLILFILGRVDLLSKYWKGLLSGILYFLKKIFKSVIIFFLSWSDPVPWVINRSTQSILDVGCGEGLPMRLIKLRFQIRYSVGVDLFDPYVNKAKATGLYDKYLIQDIRKINFKNKSFDVVLASHVLEHLPKKDALKLLDKMENIARKQIVIAAPIGHLYHPETDGNVLQLHLSSFEPDEFKKRGYKVINYGWRWLIGQGSIIDRHKSILIKDLCFVFHIICTPIFYIFPEIGTYTFVAYKKL